MTKTEHNFRTFDLREGRRYVIHLECGDVVIETSKGTGGRPLIKFVELPPGIEVKALTKRQK